MDSAKFIISIILYSRRDTRHDMAVFTPKQNSSSRNIATNNCPFGSLRLIQTEPRPVPDIFSAARHSYIGLDSEGDFPAPFDISFRLCLGIFTSVLKFPKKL